MAHEQLDPPLRHRRPQIVPLLTFAAVVIIGCELWFCLGRITSLESTASQSTAAIQQLEGEFAKVVAVRPSPVTVPTPALDDQSDELFDVVTWRTLKEAQDAVSVAKSKKDVLGLATVLADLDTWDVAPADQRAFTELKVQLTSQLRSDVKAKVMELQQAALAAPRAGFKTLLT